MLNRDFTKTNKDYFNKNKFALIFIALFLVVGIVLSCVFGLRGNFELAGYNEFTVKIGSEMNVSETSSKVEQIVRSYNAEFDTASVFGEGDDTKLVIRYLKEQSAENQANINNKIAEKLEIDVADISEHVAVAPVVRKTDYIYTAMAILLLAALSSVFAFIRYNGASAIAVIVSSIVGSASFISICAMLRLTVGLSIFALLVVLNLLIVYACLNVFESMRKANWLSSGDFGKAISTAMKESRFRMNALAVAVFVFGLLFVLIAPSAMKYVALNIMFISVVFLATVLYVLPFTWNACITHCKKRVRKVKPAKATPADEQ